MPSQPGRLHQGEGRGGGEEEEEEEKEGEEKKNIIKALLQFSLYNLYTPRFEHLFKLIQFAHSTHDLIARAHKRR